MWPDQSATRTVRVSGGIPRGSWFSYQNILLWPLGGPALRRVQTQKKLHGAMLGLFNIQ